MYYQLFSIGGSIAYFICISKTEVKELSSNGSVLTLKSHKSQKSHRMLGCQI